MPALTTREPTVRVWIVVALLIMLAFCGVHFVDSHQHAAGASEAVVLVLTVMVAMAITAPQPAWLSQVAQWSPGGGHVPRPGRDSFLPEIKPPLRV